MFEEAIARAKWLDAQLKSSGKVVGPLHGLPISVKDCYDIPGYDTSCGITSLCFQPADKTSHIVQILLDYGAVVIAKTTVPQTLLTADTDSIVFGRTTSPYNTSFGAGGSSGGEGALIALGGSAFGIGNDGAGSVRMPAAVNGIVGYKPSGYRLPLDGRAVFGHGYFATTALGSVGVTGFLSHSVRDIKLMARRVAEAEPWLSNAFIYPHPWLGLTSKRPRIAVWTENNFLHLHPPVKRGFESAVTRLRAAGYDLVPFEGPPLDRVWELQKEFCEIQDLGPMRQHLSSEPLTDIVKATNIIGQKTTPFSVKHLHDLNLEIAMLAHSMTQVWKVNGEQIDALLWVTAPHTAVPFDKYTYLGFTGLLNVIDWPALALPLDMYADKNVDQKIVVDPFNELDADIQKLYNPETFHGLPLAVTLIGRRFEDEKLISIAAEVQDVISKST